MLPPVSELGQSHSLPLTLLETSVYRGPHRFGMRPMIRLQVDLGTLEDRPSDRLPDFVERLIALLPTLERHGCSYSEPGGFIRRLRDGTWIGHVIEHVALELQTLAGSGATRGKTRSVNGRPGVYNILYAYGVAAAGLAAGAHAIRLVSELLPPDLSAPRGLERLPVVTAPADDVTAIVAEIKRLVDAERLGPTTQALVDEAIRRGIPVNRLDEQSLVQLGYGSRQRRIRASVTGHTSLIGAELAGNKQAARRILADAGLPVPRGAVVRSAAEAVVEARRLRYPVVIKPLDGNHGRGVTTGIVDDASAEAAFELAARHSRRVIVERQLPGSDHRILLVGGRMVAAAQRVPARVIGDGASTIEELIERINTDPRRGTGHEKMLTRITPDAAMHALLERAGRTLASVPAAGQIVTLRDTANLSTGGTAIDCTDDIHPDNVFISEQAALAIGLDVAGVDFLSPDITRPVRETGGGIVEVNAAPGFRMHLEPTMGSPRDVARPVIASLFPPGTRSRIPIFAITGTNGKSTTVRMVARILRQAGLRVGFTSTSGIYVNERQLIAGDASGPKSARNVLRNPGVDAAVLECARGGILREGLGFDSCDIGAVLNVSADHLGLKGVDTVEDLARVKSVVARSVARRGHAVLNADDPQTVAMACHVRGKIVWFSMHGGTTMPLHVRDHIADDGVAVVLDNGEIVLHRAGKRHTVMPAAAIPATLAGAAAFNVQNALAAAAMTAAHDIDLAVIRTGLESFTTSFEDSPGRLNVHDTHGRRVIIDYAHNPAALTALGRLVAAMRANHGRVFGMVSIPGDRRDEDLREMGRLAATIFDEIMFREAPDGRGRPTGSINALMSEGAIGAGMDAACVHRLVDEEAATAACLSASTPGDLILLMPTNVEKIWAQVQSFIPPALTEPTRRMVVAHA